MRGPDMEFSELHKFVSLFAEALHCSKGDVFH
eukprot:Gb_17849 [translate_table: standard]